MRQNLVQLVETKVAIDLRAIKDETVGISVMIWYESVIIEETEAVGSEVNAEA